MKSSKLTGIISAFAVLFAFYGCGPAKKPSPCKREDYVQVMKEQAVDFFKKGNYIDALRSIKEAEKCKPKDPGVYYIQGMIYFQRGDYYKAIDSYKQALDIEPAHTDSRLGLGITYLKLQRWDEAIAEFEKAAEDELFREPWVIYNNLGWAYLQKGEFALSEINLKKAINLNKDFCPAYSNLGELYSKQGNSYKAIEFFQKAVAKCPDTYPRARLLLAIEYGKLGYFDQACGQLKKAAAVKNAEEAEKAVEYMKLYNCPGMVLGPPGRSP